MLSGEERENILELKEFDSLTQNMPDYKMVAIPNEEVETIIMD
jgi:hypothetical protein